MYFKSIPCIRVVGTIFAFRFALAVWSFPHVEILRCADPATRSARMAGDCLRSCVCHHCWRSRRAGKQESGAWVERTAFCYLSWWFLSSDAVSCACTWSMWLWRKWCKLVLCIASLTPTVHRFGLRKLLSSISLFIAACSTRYQLPAIVVLIVFCVHVCVDVPMNACRCSYAVFPCLPVPIGLRKQLFTQSRRHPTLGPLGKMMKWTRRVGASRCVTFCAAVGAEKSDDSCYTTPCTWSALIVGFRDEYEWMERFQLAIQQHELEIK